MLDYDAYGMHLVCTPWLRLTRAEKDRETKTIYTFTDQNDHSSIQAPPPTQGPTEMIRRFDLLTRCARFEKLQPFLPRGTPPSKWSGKCICEYASRKALLSNFGDGYGGGSVRRHDRARQRGRWSGPCSRLSHCTAVYSCAT